MPIKQKSETAGKETRELTDRSHKPTQHHTKFETWNRHHCLLQKIVQTKEEKDST
jgi:hypothetical protein